MSKFYCGCDMDPKNPPDARELLQHYRHTKNVLMYWLKLAKSEPMYNSKLRIQVEIWNLCHEIQIAFPSVDLRMPFPGDEIELEVTHNERSHA